MKNNKIQKDNRIRQLVKKYEVRRRVLKALIQDLSLPVETRARFAAELHRLPRNASKTRVVNRCILTGRGHSVYRFCRISRIALRDLASKGLIPGLSKASW
uniref:Ribosomal protein S14 n=1 Tax=Chloropicon maureeniae TaxID=1461542 RepID=A0A4D6C7J2_9CHLO|nr:ribosomal protein S14 [Chloropicon maureeniae]QBX98823.1 ribosomal protein S14 [Chloropicon maureeniae]